jgi:hypothetical protein
MRGAQKIYEIYRFLPVGQGEKNSEAPTGQGVPEGSKATMRQQKIYKIYEISARRARRQRARSFKTGS